MRAPNSTKKPNHTLPVFVSLPQQILKVLARAGITEEDAEEPSASPEEELGVNDQGVFYNAQVR